MAKKKTFYEYINELHPPKYKLWITPKARVEAARQLGLSKRPEAAEPLILALADKAVQDPAVKALENIPIPPEQAKAAVKALMVYCREREQDFLEAFFSKDHNPEVMALCPEQKGHPLTAEPESYLAGAVSMVKSLDAAKAAGVEAAQAQGLDPYSRKKFRFNVRLLNKHEVFLTWPEIEEIDENIRRAEGIIAALTGKPVEEDEPVVSSGKSQTDIPAVSPEAVAQFVAQGLERKASLNLLLSEAPTLVFAAARKIAEENPHVPLKDAALMAGGAITLECPHCGPLQKSLVVKYLGQVAEQMAAGTAEDALSLDRGNAGVLVTGRCPGCEDKVVKATLDRNWILIPEKKGGAPQAAGPAPSMEEARSLDVVFAGEILPGNDPDTVKQNLARLFKIDAAKVEAFFQGKPRVIKKSVDRPTADKFVQALEKAGAKALLQPSKE